MFTKNFINAECMLNLFASFQFDEFGNAKTWWNGIIPNKNVGILLEGCLTVKN